MDRYSRELAVNGGDPVRTRPWPQWPRSTDAMLDSIRQLLLSGDWSLTGHSGRTEPLEMCFAREFAAFYETAWCVPTSSGSTAIMTVLLALGLEPEDEVLVPGNAWVACAAAVIVLKGVPVLVDVDAKTSCMFPEDLKRKITPKSRAILLVHQNGAIADVTTIRQVADRNGLILIEDCSHAHGAFVGTSRVGRIGHASVFSMQKTKLLSSGEGGAIITDDRLLYEKMARARATGRLHTFDVSLRQLQVDEGSDLVGGNFILSEFQSAILLDRLKDLDAENRTRNENAAILAGFISQIGNLEPRVDTLAGSTRVFHKFVVSLGLELMEKQSLDWYCDALTAELGLKVSPLHVPMNRNSLLVKLGHFLPGGDSTRRRLMDAVLPECESAYGASLSIRHYALLGTREDTLDISRAFEKVVHVVTHMS